MVDFIDVNFLAGQSTQNTFPSKYNKYIPSALRIDDFLEWMNFIAEKELK